MKAIRLISYACFLFTLFVYVSCNKSDKSSPDPGPVYTPDYVTASVTGRVVDDNNIPVSGATVKAGAASVTTDVNGNFKFSNVSLDKNAGFVKVEKDGFFQGSRTFTVTATNTSNVTIQLIKKAVAGTVSGNTGGHVTVPSGGNISFAANSFINTAPNAAYTGNVSVSAFFINPAAANLMDIMPGDLRGLNSDNRLTGLKTYGMMVVELTGDGGEKLQLASGKTATITFPIPTGLQTQAPATIPLWRFNDTTGLWKQEGSATKQGNDYVGTVSHFSFWNCDDPFPVIDWKVTLKYQSGSPIPNARVQLKIVGETVNDLSNGYTDSTGLVSGPVPTNKSLTMTVYSSCGTVIHTQDIGPFSTNTDMGVITIATAAPLSVTFAGTVVNCTGNVVTNGQVNILLNNKNYRTLVNNGSFSMTIERCDNTTVTAKLQAYDFSNSQQGTETSLSVSTGNVNAGELSACGSTINEFANYTVNGKQVVLTPPDKLIAYVAEDSVELATYRSDQSEFCALNFKATGLGTAEVGFIDISTQSPSADWAKSGTLYVNITEFGPAGGYIAGYLSGNVTNGTVIAPLTYRFRIKRKA